MPSTISPVSFSKSILPIGVQLSLDFVHNRLCNTRLAITAISAFSGVNEACVANNLNLLDYIPNAFSLILRKHEQRQSKTLSSSERFFRPYDFMQCFVRGNASSATSTTGIFFDSPAVTQNGSLVAGKGLGSGRFKLLFDKARLNAEFLKTPPSLILLWQPTSAAKNL